MNKLFRFQFASLAILFATVCSQFIASAVFAQGAVINPAHIYDWSDNMKLPTEDYTNWFKEHHSFLLGQTDSSGMQQLKYLQRSDRFWSSRLGMGDINGFPNNLVEYSEVMDYYASAPVCAQNAGNWTSLGPASLTNNADNSPRMSIGRVDAVYMDPLDDQKILLGAANSGIWRTVDGGITWSNVTDALYYPNLGIDNFSVSSVNPNKIFASGTYGKIFYSNDAGATWSINQAFFNMSPTDFRNVVKVMYGQNSESLVFACTENSFYRSTDNGASWTELLSIPTSGTFQYPLNNINQVFVDFMPSASSIVLTTTNLWGGLDTAQIFKSIDNGDTWEDAILMDEFELIEDTTVIFRFARLSEKVNDRFFVCLYYDPLDTSATKKHVFYESDDGGLTFTNRRIVNNLESNPRPDKFEFSFRPGTNDIYVGQIHFDRVNANNTVTSLFSGGITAYSHDDVRDIQYYFQAPDQEYFIMGNDGGINKYHVNSSSFTVLNGPSLTLGESHGLGVKQSSTVHTVLGQQDGNTQSLYNHPSFGINWYRSSGGDGGQSGFSWDGTISWTCANGSFSQNGLGYPSFF